MTFSEMVDKTREIIKPSHSLRYLDEVLPVQVDITGENRGTFYIRLNRYEVKIVPCEYNDRICLFTISDKDYAEICNGSLDAVKAYVDGKLKAEGNTEKTLKFAGIVKSLIEQNKKSGISE